MGTIKRFEDIQAWQKARELVRYIYLISSDGKFAKDFGLKNQLRRAGVSIMLNIAEGFACRSDKAFRKFLIHAHASAAEVQSAVYVALDLEYISQADFDSLYKSAEEVSKMVHGFRKYLSPRDS